MAEPDPAGSVNIAELMEDLKLLRVSSFGYSISSMKTTREKRIKELKKANGTLEEVCFHQSIQTHRNDKGLQPAASGFHLFLGVWIP